MSSLPDLSALRVQSANEVPTTEEPIVEEEEIEEIEEVTKSTEILRQEQDARLILGLYKSKFAIELKPLNKDFESLDNLELSQLNELRDRCDKILGAGSGLEAKKKMFNAVVFVLEKVGCATGVQCEGLTGNLINDKDFQRDIMRLCLKYLSADECKPEITVPMKIVTTAMQLHANNEIRIKAAEINQQLSSLSIDDNTTVKITAEPPGPPKK
jgi:hypothetical protein